MYQILVAEDENIERKVLCKNIQKHLSDRCTVLEAKNGREAVDLFEALHPEVAILDIEMPGMSGLEVARRIRQSGQPCMILFLTAFDKFSYAREAITLRALDYLLKPYDEKGTAHSEKRGGKDALLNELTECIPSQTDVQSEYDNKVLAEALNRFLYSLDEEKRNIFIRRYFERSRA